MPPRLPLLTLAALTTTALAQDANLLAGPSVGEKTTHTLVSTDMSGEFQRLDARPEEAALRLLDLDHHERERAMEIINERRLRLAMMLIDEVETVRRIEDLRKNDKGADARRLLRELWERFDRTERRDPLYAPIAENLPTLQQRRLRELIDEYWEAWVLWADRGRGEKAGRGKQGDRVRDRLAFQLFEREVNRAYERSLRHYREALEDINEAVDPTRAQRENIREHVIAHLRDTRLEATPEQRREAMLEIYRMLDDTRQEKLFVHMLKQAAPD